jgi:hypothetical protein
MRQPGDEERSRGPVAADPEAFAALLRRERQPELIQRSLGWRLLAPRVEAIAGGVAAAVCRASDRKSRVAGAAVAWSRDWRTSFDDESLRLSAWLTSA